MEIYVAAGALIAIAVVAVVLVRRTGTPLGEQGPSQLLEPGWQFYGKPTTLDPPGTVFRIDRGRKRFPVHELKVRVTTGEEAFGRHSQTLDTKMGMFAGFLGLARVGLDARRVERLTVDLEDVIRETVSDVEIDRAAQPFIRRHSFLADQRYFVVRETRSARKMIYRLDQRAVDELGGEARLVGKIEAEGTLYGQRKSGRFVLEHTFERPMRVMYLAAEIAPVTRSLGQSEPALGLRAVTEPLDWEEADDRA